MTKQQREWLSSYSRSDTNLYSLSTIGARGCGYGDLVKAGYVVNRRTEETPDLYITADGRKALEHRIRQARGAGQ